ncbi:MAG: antitoxin, partial [Propionibacteriaceae bacterium]|nr:antitoxin [Propionibacteriaceae bacterium]
MGIFDKAKDAVSNRSDKVDQGLDKVGEVADERTGNHYSDQIDRGTNLAKGTADSYLGASAAPEAAGPDTEQPDT